MRCLFSTRVRALWHVSHAAEFIGCRKEKYYLTGGFIDGYYAPNISATGLKAASLDDIVAVFKQGKLLGGAGQVGGIAEVNSNSLRYLTQEDLRAIAGALIFGLSSLMFIGKLFQTKNSVLHCLAGLFLSMLTLQILLGVANIVWFLPQWVAIMHNGIAALLLLIVITFMSYLKKSSSYA